MRALIVFLGLIVALGIPTALFVRKHRVHAHGEPIFLELAPRDPRTKVSDGHMRLEYAIARALGGDAPRGAADRTIVVIRDARGVASLARRYAIGPLAPNEHLLQCHVRDGLTRVGPDVYVFRAGEAERFYAARYGELRVGPDGEAVLVGLRDGELRPLGRKGR